MHLWKTVSNDDLFRRERFAITVHKERYLLVAGGFNEVEWRNSAVILDLQTGKSTKLPDLPPLCDYSSGVVLQGCFYVVGGRQNIFRIDLSTRKQWEKMNVLQHEHSLLSDGSNLYVLNENLSVMFNPETKKWVSLPQMRRKRMNYATAIIGNKIYMMGGVDSEFQIPLSTVEIYDIITQSWSRGPDLPMQLEGAAATVLGQYVILTGGYNEIDGMTSYCHVFDTIIQEWFRSHVMLPKPCCQHGCVSVGDSKLVLVVGSEKSPIVTTINRKHLIPNWCIIGQYLILRKLLDKGRAQMIIKKNSGSGEENEESIIHKLFMKLDRDTFCAVISFL